jgi:hypothetical protein
MFSVLRVVLSIAIPLASLATGGLRAAHADPKWLARHPGRVRRRMKAAQIFTRRQGHGSTERKLWG